MRNKLSFSKVASYLGILLFAIFSLPNNTSAQLKLSPGAEISLYTCGSGEDLYSLFGHTAIRVEDSLQGIDRVYNYGTFSFSEDFYWKFTMGKLNYRLSAYGFQGFESSYREEERSIHKQKLLLTKEQKDKLYSLLEINALPQNAYYLYDFFYDNCSTRPRVMIEQAIGKQPNYKANENARSFRDYIEDYLVYSPWADFGIDIGLGSVCDTPTTDISAMFLPATLFDAMATAELNGEPLVAASEAVYIPEKSRSLSLNISDPIVIMWGLFILLLFVSVIERKKGLRFLWLDRILFSLIGLVGWLVAFLWFFTDHQATKDNWNILWAIPSHFPLAFFIFSKHLSKFQKYYQWLSLISALILLIGWTIIPQTLHAAVLPLLLIIIVRLAMSLIRIRYK